MSGNWWIVFAAFLCLVFMFAVPTFMIPVLYSPIIDEFGWSRTQVTLFATVKFMAGAVVGVMFGFLLDRVSNPKNRPRRRHSLRNRNDRVLGYRLARQVLRRGSCSRDRSHWDHDLR